MPSFRRVVRLGIRRQDSPGLWGAGLAGFWRQSGVGGVGWLCGLGREGQLGTALSSGGLTSGCCSLSGLWCGMMVGACAGRWPDRSYLEGSGCYCATSAARVINWSGMASRTKSARKAGQGRGLRRESHALQARVVKTFHHGGDATTHIAVMQAECNLRVKRRDPSRGVSAAKSGGCPVPSGKEANNLYVSLYLVRRLGAAISSRSGRISLTQ